MRYHVTECDNCGETHAQTFFSLCIIDEVFDLCPNCREKIEYGIKKNRADRRGWKLAET